MFRPSESERENKIFFDVCRLFFSLSFPLSLGVNRPLQSAGLLNEGVQKVWGDALAVL